MHSSAFLGLLSGYEEAARETERGKDCRSPAGALIWGVYSSARSTEMCVVVVLGLVRPRDTDI